MIYIDAPFYNDKSNGISVAYELVRILNRAGIATRLLCNENERYDVVIPEDLKPYYISKAGIPQKVNDEDIFICLDTSTGTAVQAKNVIYWLLNKPGALTGEEIHFQPDDILVAFSTLVHQKLPQLFLLKDERDLFYRMRNTCKNKDTISIYFGKVNTQLVLDKNPLLKKLIRQYPKVNVITRLNPSDREKTLQLVAQSNLLISYDALSNINYEATLLETPVLLMDDSYRLADITYNVGNFGYAFREQDIKKARESISQAFSAYCKHLENQNNYVVDSIKHITGLLQHVKSSPDALAANKKTNKLAANDFLAFHRKTKVPFKNIDFPSDIPLKTRRILSEALKEPVSNTIPEPPSVQNERIPFQRKLYAMIKPWWVDNMYKKIPGNLKLHELLFLIFRRMYVFWKK